MRLRGGAVRYKIVAIRTLVDALISEVESKREARSASAADAPSPDDEDNWDARKLRAQALLAELDLENKRRAVLPIEQVRDVLDTIADQHRRLAEKLERKYGKIARSMVEATLDDCDRLVDGSGLNGRDQAGGMVDGGQGGVPPTPAAAPVGAVAQDARVGGKRDRDPKRPDGRRKVPGRKPARPAAAPE